MNLKKLTAFTLAETLIVMGIIGVVATLTIPSLTNSTNNKDTVARVRKAQTTLEDAFGRMIAENGDMTEWSETLNSQTLGNRMVASMKLTKNCKIAAGCFAKNSVLYSSNAASASQDLSVATANIYKFLLASGESVALSVDNATCTASAVDSSDNTASSDMKQICGTAIIDVDGPGKGKHKHGTDLFQFYITRHGFYPVGFEGDTKFKYADNCTKIASNVLADAIGCTSWVVTNGNLDYKKTDTSGKCLTNANKTLDFATNTSCD